MEHEPHGRKSRLSGQMTFCLNREEGTTTHRDW
jgi:hypothetical protein